MDPRRYLKPDRVLCRCLQRRLLAMWTLLHCPRHHCFVYRALVHLRPVTCRVRLGALPVIVYGYRSFCDDRLSCRRRLFYRQAMLGYTAVGRRRSMHGRRQSLRASLKSLLSGRLWSPCSPRDLRPMTMGCTILGWIGSLCDTPSLPVSSDGVRGSCS